MYSALQLDTTGSIHLFISSIIAGSDWAGVIQGGNERYHLSCWYDNLRGQHCIIITTQVYLHIIAANSASLTNLFQITWSTPPVMFSSARENIKSIWRQCAPYFRILGGMCLVDDSRKCLIRWADCNLAIRERERCQVEVVMQRGKTEDCMMIMWMMIGYSWYWSTHCSQTSWSSRSQTTAPSTNLEKTNLYHCLQS